MSKSQLPRAVAPALPDAPHRVWTLLVVGIAAFMTALDTLVVTSALPVLRVHLHTGLSSLEWTVNGYNLAFACLLLTGAALGDRFGRRRMFTVGLAVFTAASAAAALSPGVGFLVGARALQGAGAAIVMPLTLTLLTEAVPAEKRASAIGLWGGIVGLAVATGPLVGGAVVGGLNWHWMFWLNVPVGLVVIAVGARRLTESFGPRPRLDVVGVAIAGLGALGVTWALVRATSLGWASPEVLVSLLAGLAGLYGFIEWERRTPQPMFSLQLFRNREFAAANAVSFFMYAGLFGALFLMAQLLQTALGYSPLEAGLRLLPWTAPPMLIAPLAGTLANKYGNRPFMVLGLVMQATGLAWVALVASPHVSFIELGAAFTIAGVGTSFCFPTVANAVMGSVPMAEVGVASGINSTLRELGGVFGVSILALVFDHGAVYSSPVAFVASFRGAVWFAVAFSAVGAVAATLAHRTRGDEAELGVLVGEVQTATAA